MSLFFKPAYGDTGAPTPVEVTWIEEEDGLHGSPTCQLALDGGPGELLGAVGGGLRALLTMLSHARLDAARTGALAVAAAEQPKRLVSTASRVPAIRLHGVRLPARHAKGVTPARWRAGAARARSDHPEPASKAFDIQARMYVSDAKPGRLLENGMRRTKEDAERTRTAILDTAERLFCEGGVTQTSLEMIARQAGVTRGAVYWHFKDKHDILHALRERCALPHETLLRAAADGGHPDPLVLLRSAGIEMLELFEQDEHRQRLFQIMAGLATDDGTLSALRDGREDMHRVLHGLTRQAERSGRLNGGFTSEEAAILLGASMNGLLSEWLQGGRTFRLSELGGRMISKVIEMIDGNVPASETKQDVKILSKGGR